MIRLRVAALLLAAATAPAPPVEGQSAPGTVEFTAGGIPVIFKPIAANDVVAVRLYLRGGSAGLSPANAGIEAVMTDLATTGTQRYSKDEFAARATATGTQIGGAAAHDYTVLTANAVRQHWDEAWELFTQAALHPTFPEAELAQLKGQMVNGLRQQRDDPDALLALLSDSVSYAGSALAPRPGGTEASIQALTRDAIAEWHRRRMTKENLLLVVVGNVSREDLARKVERAMASLPERGGAVARATLAPQTKAPPLVVQRAIPTNYISGVFRAPSQADEDHPATRLALYILSDRLFEEIRTRRNLSYAVQSFMYDRGGNVGRLYVTAVEPDTTLKLMLAEVRRLQTEPVPAKRLQENKNVLTTSYWTAQLTNMSQAAQLGSSEILGAGWENAARFVERLQAVTAADVQRASQKYLRDGRFVVIGDPAKIDATLFSSW